MHGHPVETRRARRLGVLPGEMIEGAAGHHLDLPTGPQAQSLGQHAGGGLGTSDDLESVARGHEGELHRARPPVPGHLAEDLDEPGPVMRRREGVEPPVPGGHQPVGQGGVPPDPVDGGGHRARPLGGEQDAGVAERLGHRAGGEGHDGQIPARIASSSGMQKPSCSDRQTNTSASRVPGGELGIGEVLAVADGIGQAELVGQGEHRLGVRRGHRRAHQVEPGVGVVPAADRATGPRPGGAGPCWARAGRRRGARCPAVVRPPAGPARPVDGRAAVVRPRPGWAPPRWPGSPAAGARSALNDESAIPRVARGARAAAWPRASATFAAVWSSHPS